MQSPNLAVSRVLARTGGTAAATLSRIESPLTNLNPSREAEALLFLIQNTDAANNLKALLDERGAPSVAVGLSDGLHVAQGQSLEIAVAVDRGKYPNRHWLDLVGESAGAAATCGYVVTVFELVRTPFGAVQQ